MTELLSQAYAPADGYFYESSSLKILIRDITDPFREVPDGKVGAVNIIDLANNIHNDQVKRLAVIAVYSISMFTMAERINTKPFNPLLGETYELMTQDF